MPLPRELSHFLTDLFPEATPELLRLFGSAAENAALLRSDYYTIRDWLEIADYRDHPWVAALLLVMLLALDEGSFCVELSEPALARRLADLVSADDAADWPRRLCSGLDSDPCPRLIGTSAEEHKPIILHRCGARRFLYFQKYLKAELVLDEQLRARLAQTSNAVDATALRGIFTEVLAADPLRRPDGAPLRLDREQHWALAAALTQPLAIVSGGPGTGKTSLVLTLLRCLVRSGCAADRIALAAPTGRAAQRLGDAVRAGLERLPSARVEGSADAGLRQVAPSTLHQLLGYRPHRNFFTRHSENPIPADVVIVDEVSMVGLVLMAQLFQALAPTTRLVLLGDKDQLPSVDAGAVLANLVADGAAAAFGALAEPLQTAWPEIDWPSAEPSSPLARHVVALTTNHRSQPEIRAAAQALNAGDAGVVDTLPALRLRAEADAGACWAEVERQGGCRLLEQIHESPQEVRIIAQQWLEQAYFRSRQGDKCLAELVASVEEAPTEAALLEAFALLERYRILTLVREGPWGCVDLNRCADECLRPRLDQGARGALFAGAPVLIVRNDARQGLYNGDVGLALRQRGSLRVVFARQEGFLWLPAEALPAHELGVALTVHKSQGSEYAHVLTVLPPEGGRRLLTRELLYTAVTRAKSLAILCGTKEALRFAIGRRVVRESGILQALHAGAGGR
jgi:exodeoxyribonuclease V alpha subunit